jgi:cob(I)alamin adenosyltransferase
MTEQQPQEESKAPVVDIKSKAKPKAKDAKPSAATVKLLERLTEVGKEIDRLEQLKEERTQLVGKLTAAKVPTAEIAKAAHLSVARTWQVQAKTK